MYLFDGGHLSHGWIYKDTPVSISSKIYKISQYHVDPDTGRFDYKRIESQAQREKPKLIISGGTAYPREIDHKQLAHIAHQISALYMADIAHEAGLVAAGVNASPFPFADIVTLTTHKTLRGPKGALIFCKKEYQDAIDRSVFPSIQGGPMNNNIAGIAIALKQAQTKAFHRYASQVIRNAQALAKALLAYHFTLISGGTDKHLLLIDLRNKSISGTQAAYALAHAGIILNKNTIPAETGSPSSPSGIRLGTPFVTTQGMREKEMQLIATLINEAIAIAKQYRTLSFEDFQQHISNCKESATIRQKVADLCHKFPLPG